MQHWRLARISTAIALAATLAPAQVFAALSDASRIGPGGVGPIVFGTTPSQATATGTTFTQTKPAPGSTCFYLRPSAPAGLSLMVEGGNIRRAEATAPSIGTTDGFRVGDPVAKLGSFYGSRAQTSPDKYDPHASTLAILPKAGASDAPQRLVYKIKGGKVYKIIAGLRPQVDYVEGCS